MHSTPYDRYYHEISPEDAVPALGLLEPMAVSAFETPTQYAGWKDFKIPSTFIKCAKDTAVPLELCDTYVERLRDAGVDVHVETIDAGHCAHFTLPSPIVGIILELDH